MVDPVDITGVARQSTRNKKEPVIGGFFPDAEGPWNQPSGCAWWTDEGRQWRAAYKNVPFAVDTDTKSGGRRVHVHEYPAREWWDNEDLGRLRQQFDVTAFIFGDQVDQWAEKLFAACTDRNRGTLVLPARVPVEARCLTIESTWNANTLGRMEITMRFTLESDMPKGTTPSQVYKPSKTMLEGQMAMRTQHAIKEARYTFEKEITNNKPHVSRAAAVKVMKVAAQSIRAAAKKARLSPKEASEVMFAAGHMERNAAEMADSQRTTANTLTAKAGVQSQKVATVGGTTSIAGAGGSNTLTGSGGSAIRASTQQVIPAFGTYAEGFGGAMEKALQALVKGADNPGDLVQALEPLMKLVPQIDTAAHLAVLTASTEAEIALARSVAGYARRLGIGYGTFAAQKIAPEKEPDATNARNRINGALDTEIARAADTADMHSSLRRLKGAVTEFSSWWSQNGGAVQKIRRRTNEPMANILADSGGSDVQVMKANGIRHPLHSPTVVSVAATTGVKRGGLSHREFR